MRACLLPILPCAVLLLACGSGGGEAVLLLDPPTPVVQPGERAQLSLTSTETLQGEPEWEIQEYHGGALLRSTGWTTTYLAPQAAGAFHLILTARRADGTRIRQTETLKVAATPLIEPPAIRLAPGAVFTFTGRIKGMPKGSLLWASEPEGAISPAGVYTAPERPGTYRITATCAQDPDLSATATVTVE